MPQEKPGTVRGIIFQEEVAPTTGRRHLQGFLRLHTARSFDFVKGLFEPIDKHPHLEPSVAPAAAVEYCRKGETRDGECYEEGDLTFEQGKSNELRALVEDITNGATIRTVVQSNPYQFVLHTRGLQALRAAVLESIASEDRPLRVYVLYGPSGCGKSRYCYEQYPDLYKLDRASSTGVWWDGYDGQKTLLLDDFYGWIPYSHLLNLLDRYKQRLDVKGGYTYALWSTILITSNEHPREWYTRLFLGGVPEALARRITSSLDATGCSRDTILQFVRDGSGGRPIRGEQPTSVSRHFNDACDPSIFGQK